MCVCVAILSCETGFVLRVWGVIEEREVMCIEMVVNLSKFMYLGLTVNTHTHTHTRIWIIISCFFFFCLYVCASDAAEGPL